MTMPREQSLGDDRMSAQGVKRDRRLALGIVSGVIGTAIVATFLVSLAPPPKVKRITAAPVKPAAVLNLNLANDVAAAVASAEDAVRRADASAAEATALAERARRMTPLVRATLPGGMSFRGEGDAGVPEGVGLLSGGAVAFGAGFVVGGVRNGVGVDCARADCTGPSYFGDFRADRPTGVARITFPDGGVYRGDVTEGAPDGFGELRRADGSRYVGAFTKGRRDGHGREIAADGKVEGGFWVADQLSERSPS